MLSATDTDVYSVRFCNRPFSFSFRTCFVIIYEPNAQQPCVLKLLKKGHMLTCHSQTYKPPSWKAFLLVLASNHNFFSRIKRAT